MKSILYVGMDVHKDTYSLCALDPNTNQVVNEVRCAADPKLVKRFVEHTAKQYPDDTTFLTGYEAGCLGYSLYKSLQSLDIPCVILAPTTMVNSVKGRVIKNDKMDARMIANNLAAQTYTSVYVPDQSDEEIKEYIRMRQSFKKSQKRIKQQISALLLRQGLRYSKTKWTPSHLEWIKALNLASTLKTILDEYLVELEDLSVKIARFDDQIALFAQGERYQEQVGKLVCLKGIAVPSAMTIHVEISDFSRFSSARKFMAYLGLVPSEHSSGDKIRKGALTKQGNSTVRTTLIECTRGLIRGQIGHRSKVVVARQRGQSAAVISYADRAVERLQRHYHHLIENGKSANVAVVAIARELAGFIWGLETGQIDF